MVGRLAVTIVGRLLGEFVVGRLAVDSPLTETIVGCTGTVSVPIRALSGELVLIHGIPQQSLSSVMYEHCIFVGRLLGEFVVGRLAEDVVGRLLGEFVVGRLAVGSSPLTGTIAGCTGTVSVPICALSCKLVLIHGTPQSSLSLGMCEHCIVVGRLLSEVVVGSMLAVDVVGRLLGEFVVGGLAVGSSLLTGTIAGCTGTVSVPICALSGEYVLIHRTPQIVPLVGNV